MFQKRNNSQKPTDALIDSFKASFSDFHFASRSNLDAAFTTLPPIVAQDVAIVSWQLSSDNETGDWITTPRPINKRFLFTPLISDPNSFNLISFTNESPNIRKLTPGESNTLEHPQTGHFYNSNFSIDIIAPLSLLASEGSMYIRQPSTAIIEHGFPQYALSPYIFQDTNPFTLNQCQHHIEEFVSDVEMQEQSTINPSDHPPTNTQLRLVRPQSAEKFRYHLILNAPTAMAKSNEIPVSYLNKGQVYAISIIDSQQTQIRNITSKYRSYFRISFGDEQQRKQAAVSWKHWKEGRGMNEAHHRGGRLQAVEFVGPDQNGSIGQSSAPPVELQSTSFDGFCVTWSPVQSGTSSLAQNGMIECSVNVRFNFLSTDFSHSKGVKGIPFRLCVKTQLLSSHSVVSLIDTVAEICFCNIKIFRDHGAERKHSHDVAHIRKTISKLTQQIAQVKHETSDFVKAHKRKQKWSIASRSNAQHSESQEELRITLLALQDMLTSTRPTSPLFLRGEELDDPDLYPVYLLDEPQDLPNITRSITDGICDAEHRSRPDIPIKTQKSSQNPGSLTEWMEALKMAPKMYTLKSVACFYVQSRIAGKPVEGKYYRAVYLTQRTLNNLISGIMMHVKIESSKVLRAFHVNHQGLKIVLDDQVVKELPEGQDMIAEFQEIKASTPIYREWDPLPKGIQGVDELEVTNTIGDERYELKLRF